MVKIGSGLGLPYIDLLSWTCRVVRTRLPIRSKVDMRKLCSSVLSRPGIKGISGISEGTMTMFLISLPVNS